MIDWESDKAYVLCNPRLPAEQKLLAEKLLLEALPGHIWLATSGSTQSKWVALSKKAFLASAAAVNTHLEATQNDVWLLALPTFHAGGLAILARAFLSSASVVHFAEKWNPTAFVESAKTHRATVASLVPAQVHDLVSLKLKAPSTLRAVLVGGGYLAESLRTQAAELGWPLLATYAMTECASSIAIASPLAPEKGPKVLPHMRCQILAEGILRIQSKALFTCYGCIDKEKLELWDPKVEGWFTTEDVVEITDGFLMMKGRLRDIIKIGGENVELLRLEALLDELKRELLSQGDAAVVALPDERLGMALHLIHDGPAAESIKVLVETFNARVMPYERIRSLRLVESLPRSPLGKLLR